MTYIFSKPNFMQEDHSELSANDQELSQDQDRSEGTPSWEESSDTNQEEERESDSGPEQDELVDAIQKEETLDSEEQKNTPEEGSRRVLKFSDYFNKS
jgi:hypothetical protein